MSSIQVHLFKNIFQVLENYIIIGLEELTNPLYGVLYSFSSISWKQTVTPKGGLSNNSVLSAKIK